MSLFIGFCALSGVVTLVTLVTPPAFRYEKGFFGGDHPLVKWSTIGTLARFCLFLAYFSGRIFRPAGNSPGSREIRGHSPVLPGKPASGIGYSDHRAVYTMPACAVGGSFLSAFLNSAATPLS